MLGIHLIVNDAAAAADWYTQVLGAQERRRITLPDGRLIGLELWFGETRLVLADEFPDHDAVAPTTTGCTSAVFYVYVDDVDAAFSRAVANGATVHRPLADWFTGDRDGQLVDPFGHRWGLSQHLLDVDDAEIERAAAIAFGAPVGGA
jgi:PhnB protein